MEKVNMRDITVTGADISFNKILEGYLVNGLDSTKQNVLMEIKKNTSGSNVFFSSSSVEDLIETADTVLSELDHSSTVHKICLIWNETEEYPLFSVLLIRQKFEEPIAIKYKAYFISD